MAATIQQRHDEDWLILSDGEDRRPSYALVHALGGWLRGFRPVDGRFESRLTFRDESRASQALETLRAALDEGTAPPAAWTTRRAGGTTTVGFGDEADEALTAAFHRLSEGLAARGSGLVGFAPSIQGERLVGFAVDDARLAEWLARALWALRKQPLQAERGESAPVPTLDAAPISAQRHERADWPGWREELAAAVRGGYLAALWPTNWAPWAYSSAVACRSEPEQTIISAAENGQQTLAIQTWCIAVALCHRRSLDTGNLGQSAGATLLLPSTGHRRIAALLPRAWYPDRLASPWVRPGLATAAAAPGRSDREAGAAEVPNAHADRLSTAPKPVAAPREVTQEQPRTEEESRSRAPGEPMPPETAPGGEDAAPASPERSPARQSVPPAAIDVADSVSLAILDLESGLDESPKDSERRALALLATEGGRRHEPRLRLLLADAHRRQGDTRRELAELRRALAIEPDRVDEFVAVLALRRILEAHGCAAGEDPVVRSWLPAVARIGADETLLLLAAEAATVLDGDLAASLLKRAVPGRGATIGPTEAVEFLGRVDIESDRLKTLLIALDRAGFPAESDVARAVAELFGALDPLDGAMLARLVEFDVTQGAAWLPERLDRVVGALAAPLTGGSPARQLAGIARPMEDAVDYLLRDAAVPLDTERMYEYLLVAVRAALAAGNPATALQLTDIAEDASVRRLQRRHLVDLADQIAVHPISLGQSLVQQLAELYFRIGSDLLERLERAGDPVLIDEIVRALQDLDPQLAGLLAEGKQEKFASAQLPVLSTNERPHLAGRSIVIFGADGPTRLRACERLAELGADVRDVPPAYERNFNKEEIRQRIGGADLVVEVWRQMKHRDSDALDAALVGLTPPPARRRAAGTGKSSIVRAALEWAAQAA